MQKFGRQSELVYYKNKSVCIEICRGGDFLSMVTTWSLHEYLNYKQNMVGDAENLR
jgi:hypothetical protein